MIGVASFVMHFPVNETYSLTCKSMYKPFVYARIDDEIMNWIKDNTDDRTGIKKSNCDDI